ncbi:D-alanyl-D-alanine carboxypeptidase/D-alanyl-D-alanine-endopeptidase [Sphingomonas sp. ABOLD]|uniref:D-alanyl-D-alanine carboxypeptidase/D-alanyl-D-alanine-endopeptidase (Penicillin-binding protein 4) n=1 Tax=Sphingomonas trueperi TaxID=53317 RepID=A0A7X5Y2T5_9SPHN|nr:MULTISPECIES: D-alanyl-D-alanine carboxypeptidase/D-alanyl-D-alanine-endopeptidase [Sphingomonas]NJB99989.1 D-alanyl-D-alanine carboxypeptidase/D-alanyl-D-alanine-endopeptidase (penicillin-binding protein 4) [Sphingomonas trueperi]RSV34117.1 D-alanyl-D-alanine carboxypeptidase/D-alanyl-D-alanine-endopeptidase [Sphingomonas sp. ABOLE]RSV38767.1 D-alanyl-D-alanine carboxypeptidase/D-alanyl-D-alanine-endopeptidase [Sphingomonas sp. ABOLD]
MMWSLMLPLLLAGAPADAPLPPAVAEALAKAPPGTRIGLVVVDAAGREIVALRPDERFVPASNTKLFTTAAAFATLDVAAPDGAGGATVRLEGRGTPTVVLAGHGDARLSSAPDCRVDCLADLAAAVARRTRAVRDVVGDDSAFPDERWPLGMSWNNMEGVYGTGISALTLDDNVVTLTVRPAAEGTAPGITSDGYYRIENVATTGAGGSPKTLTVERMPGSDLLRLTGSIAAGTSPVVLAMGVEDPAHRAAWRFAQLLRAAGVRVAGHVTVRHRPLAHAEDPALSGAIPAAAVPAPALERLTPPPLAEDLRLTNKTSQNLHAELLLRRLGSSGAVADGHAVVDALLARAGIARTSYDFADGAGMSSYNRVTPRATVALLRWAETQPWGAAWRATFPVAATDGTLARRFVGTPLAGRLWAKTGTLNAANALAGQMRTASGRTLTFAAYANDMPGGASATAVIDAALVAIAAAY